MRFATRHAARYDRRMAKTILVCGFGPGISTAVAEKFGAEGFQVALVARSAERLDAGVKALAAKGIKAAGFTSNLGDPSAAPALLERVRASLGAVSVIQWSAYSGAAGDLLAADVSELRNAIDVGVNGLVAVVQAALPDLKKGDKPAILVTNGGFGTIDPTMDAMGVQYGAMGLAVASAAKNKLVGLLSKRLEGDGIYVGQVTVMGVIKGSAFDQGNSTLEGSAVGERFWSLYQARTDIRATAP
jgi:NADP-dependent 3-hydroxy acid dehydrogenase YdfG